MQVRHTLSAPSFTVGGAWTAACLRSGAATPLLLLLHLVLSWSLTAACFPPAAP